MGREGYGSLGEPIFLRFAQAFGSRFSFEIVSFESAVCCRQLCRRHSLSGIDDFNEDGTHLSLLVHMFDQGNLLLKVQFVPSPLSRSSPVEGSLPSFDRVIWRKCLLPVNHICVRCLYCPYKKGAYMVSRRQIDEERTTNNEQRLGKRN